MVSAPRGLVFQPTNQCYCLIAMKVRHLPRSTELSHKFIRSCQGSIGWRELPLVSYAMIFLVAFISGNALRAQTLTTTDDIPRHERVDLVANVMRTSPAYPVVGERVRIELAVTNRSDNPARSVQVAFFAGSGKAGSTTVNVGPRQTVLTSFDWSAGPDGVQQLTAFVDPEHHFAEENYADNVATADVVVAKSASKGADFTVSNLELIKADGRSLMRATLTNRGKVAQSVPVVFKADDHVIAVRYVAALPAGQESIVDVDYPDIRMPSRIAVEVNPRFRSPAKSSNLLTRDLAPSVDLRVDALSVHAAQFEASRARRVTVCFRVVNAGTTPVSKSFRTSIFPGTVKSGHLETDFILISNLAAGDTTYVSRTVDSPFGEFDIRIEADADHVIADENRANNVVTSHFKNPVPDIDRWVTIGPRLINNGSLGAVGVLFKIAVDPQNPSIIYVSAPRSGVWKTFDGGANWQPITDSLPTLLVSALAIDPSNPLRVYLATTDSGFFTSDDGGGIWRSLDRPGVITGLSPTVTEIETLVVSPSNPDLLLLTSPAGINVHNAASISLNKWSLPLSPGPVGDLIADPSHPGTFFATLTGSNTGIFRSFDSGQNWAKLSGCPSKGLPSMDGVQNITLAMSGSTLYAALKFADKLEVFRTAGFSCSIGGFQESEWEKRFTLTGDEAKSSLFRINADPNDPKFVYIAGVDFRVSTDGASSFSIVSGQQPHTDHHGFAADPSDSAVIFVVGDGGIYRSSNRGKKDTWQFIGNGIFNVQFYDSAVAATDSTMVIGGTQDNGTLEYSGSTEWDSINGRDGATVAIDPSNAQIKYSMNQGPESMQKRVGSGNWANISCGEISLLNECNNLAFQLHPGAPATLIAPCQSLWQATSPVCDRFPNRKESDPGAPLAWQVILPQALVTGKVVRSAIDPTLNLYYAGTSQGEIWAGPAGADWRRIISLAGNIQDIDVDSDDPATVYITSSMPRLGRVFRLHRSTTSPTATTITSADITANLPLNLTVNALTVDRLNPFTIYAGTAKGVYRGRSLDRGVNWNWVAYMNGFPLADVRDLEVHPSTGVMLAATFGRSAYEVNTGDPFGSVLSATGKITFLRANDLGSGFGPPSDFLDAEVIVLLDSQPGKGFGFTLRNDSERADHRGMLDVLRSAFTKNRNVRVDYIRTGLRNGRIIRVETVN
jgi:hypothetical protein